jgi:selenocysteine lyase/cysteine desulfurase
VVGHRYRLHEYRWFENIQQQEELQLLEYGTKRLLEIEGLKIFVPQKKNFRNFG